MNDDLRLIEDYLPIEAISKEASREKSVRKGHISTLHLWWARRPLVACRAAVYGALVPADRWVRDINVRNADGKNVEAFKNGTKKGLNRKHAKEFVTKLCRYPKTDPKKPQEIREKRETEAAIAEAQKHILQAHAERLTKELEDWRRKSTTDGTDSTDKKKTPANSSHPCHPCDPWSDPSAPPWVKEFKFAGGRVTYDDIVAGRAPRPRVLDMFAGGGAIPLEALRLGCEAYALDLNPVAHIIELCTLVYPQTYGKPDHTARGMTGPKNAKGEATWGGLANEVRYWGNWVLERVRKEIGDLYPLIPDPEYKKPSEKEEKAAAKSGARGKQLSINGEEEDGEEKGAGVAIPDGYLMAVAYLWTRTVRCKNPSCGAQVPLVKQTWLCKKAGRYIALKMVSRRGEMAARFEVVASDTEEGLGFDPEAFSKAGNATCPFCGTVADSDYAKLEGCSKRLGEQLMAIVCTRSGKHGRVYLGSDESGAFIPDANAIHDRLLTLSRSSGVTGPSERIVTDAKNANFCILYGLTTFGDLFSTRQEACLVALSAAARAAAAAMHVEAVPAETASSIATYLGILVDRQADYNSRLARWHNTGEKMSATFGRQALPMVWDYAELAPFGGASGGANGAINWIVEAIRAQAHIEIPASVRRGSATALPWHPASIDTVITDPPYYDNVPYADIADFFYVWLKRSIGDLYPDHFSTEGTPKKAEAVADATRHRGDKGEARRAYEHMMAEAFAEANRVLKPGGQLAVVYAHKTTLGWSTLVDALRTAGFMVTEAWPLDTEMKARLRGMESAALASSIFLVARKRGIAAGVGNYEVDVQPDLHQIVRERVETLWQMGIGGADLVIACVGAGLRAFTKYEKVEYANGEEVPAEKFLAEVEGVVLDTMMGKLFGQTGTSVSAIDPASRFYVLWRFVYKAAEIDAGEAIVFTYGQHVELDGPNGLSDGKDALVEKKKGKYRVRDFTERAMHPSLGRPAQPGAAVPLVDLLHRVLWLMENSPRKLEEFLEQARPNREQLRALAQALAGPALSGKVTEDAAKLVSTTPAEQSALAKLLANWRSVIETRLAADEGGLFERTK